jgi:hypothetical protein
MFELAMLELAMLELAALLLFLSSSASASVLSLCAPASLSSLEHPLALNVYPTCSSPTTYLHDLYSIVPSGSR